MRKRLISFLVAASMLTAVGDAQAVKITIKFPVTVGLDLPTRALLEHYPTAVREEFVKGIAQSLPLIDTEVNNVFNRYDESLNSTVAKVECFRDGSLPALGDAAQQIMSKIKNQPSGSNATTNLIAYASKLREGMSGSQGTADIYAKYSDIGATVYQVRCQFHAAPDEVKASINTLTEQYYVSLRVWQFIHGLNCGTADSCFASTYAFTENVISAADPRDVLSVGARETFKDIPHNNIHLVKPGILKIKPNVKKGEIDLASYEMYSRQMQSIQFDIAVASLKRSQLAMNRLDAIENDIIDAEEKSVPVFSGYQSSSSVAVTDAVKGGRSPGYLQILLNQLQNLDFSAVNALSNSEVVTTRVSSLETRRNKTLLPLQTISAGYDARITILKSDEAVAAQKIEDDKHKADLKKEQDRIKNECKVGGGPHHGGGGSDGGSGCS